MGERCASAARSLTEQWLGASEVKATQDLVWKPGGKLGNVEDELGPPWVEPNRHCTLMLYLNNPEAGGAETTFPHAAEKRLMMPSGELSQREVVHPGMDACSKGVRVEPFKGGGALFYHKFGNGKNDVKSMHGGCPPPRPVTPASSHPCSLPVTLLLPLPPPFCAAASCTSITFYCRWVPTTRGRGCLEDQWFHVEHRCTTRDAILPIRSHTNEL